MASPTLLPDPSQVELVRLVPSATCVTVVVRAHAASSRCPVCGASSAHVHSRYARQVADLPWFEVAVRLQLQVRRFFCDQEACPRAIFTERLPGVVAPYARRTLRLTRLVELVGFLLGGNAGSRLLRQMARGWLGTSRDTVLRAIRRAILPSPGAVEALSVDDFALRRRVSYGTLLVDLERHRVVDLLPDRSDVTFARWLRAHPGVRVISRDRGGDYAAGATLGAPHATQIADRFHLLVNAGEVLERCLTRHQASLREAARHIVPPDAISRTTKHTPAEERRKLERRAERQRKYEQVMELCEQGVSAHQIARRLGMGRSTVAKFLRVGAFPEMASHPRPRQIDPYLPYLPISARTLERRRTPGANAVEGDSCARVCRQRYPGSTYPERLASASRWARSARHPFACQGGTHLLLRAKDALAPLETATRSLRARGSLCPCPQATLSSDC
jgi:transposase